MSVARESGFDLLPMSSMSYLGLPAKFDSESRSDRPEVCHVLDGTYGYERSVGGVLLTSVTCAPECCD